MDNNNNNNEEDTLIHHPHVLAIPYPSQGHVNPMLQLCKRLASKGARTTLAITNYISKTHNPKSSDSVNIDTLSDGFDEGGFNQSEGVEDYLMRMEIEGSKTLEDLITKYADEGPIDCIIYDAFLPWALRVAKKYKTKAACFFTQACSVNYVYYHLYHGLLELPISTPSLVEIPGLPPLEVSDLPSFLYVQGSYPAYLEMVLNQYKYLEEAEFVLVNTFYKLEEKVIDSMSQVVSPLLTVGPTMPSYYLDNRIEHDDTYGLNLFETNSSSATTILNWLDTKPKGSVIYIAFGSMDGLSKQQMHELAYAIQSTDYNFLWAVRDSNKQEKLPSDFLQESTDRNKGLFVHWSPQLQVLSNEAVGCFLSHGGWNSTAESLSLGVLMVVFPQWSDQPMDAKLVQDVWRFGVRVVPGPYDGGAGQVIAKRDDIERCVREVMESERGKEMKKNAVKWRELAVEAVSEGGTSDINIQSFISQLIAR